LSGGSLVDFAAPGGTAGLLVEEGIGAICPVTRGVVTLNFPCYAYDLVVSTARGGPASVSTFAWAQGTSMAAPMVAGVAALIVEANGGSMYPHQVRTRIQRAAADLGAPGNDAFYDLGWVNAYRAVTLP